MDDMFINLAGAAAGWGEPTSPSRIRHCVGGLLPSFLGEGLCCGGEAAGEESRSQVLIVTFSRRRKYLETHPPPPPHGSEALPPWEEPPSNGFPVLNPVALLALSSLSPGRGPVWLATVFFAPLGAGKGWGHSGPSPRPRLRCFPLFTLSVSVLGPGDRGRLGLGLSTDPLGLLRDLAAGELGKGG